MSDDVLAESRAEYVARLETALERIVSGLKRRPEVKRVLLFGSYSEGRRDLLTDLDLLVVMESHEDFLSRTARLYRELEAGVDLDLLVYTPEELESLRHRAFVRHVLATGKVLYERGA
jgi:uncharacterized protein